MSAGVKGGTSFSVCVESIFGSYDSTNVNLLDLTTLVDWLPCYPTRSTVANAINAAEQPLYIPERISPAPGAAQDPEPESPWSGGAWKQRLVGGGFEVEMDLRYMADNAIDSTALYVLLGSMMGCRQQTTGATVTCTAAVSVSSFEVDPSDISKFKGGDIIARDIAGSREYRRVVGTSGGDTVIVFPAFGTGIALNEVVKLCHVFYPVAGFEAAASGSFAVRYQDTNRTAYLTGCRVVKVDCMMRGPDGRSPALVFTIRHADGQIGADEAIVTPKHYGVTGTLPAKWMVAPALFSSSYSMAAPASGTYTQLGIRPNPRFSIAADMETDGGFNIVRSGHGDYTIVECRATLMLDLPDDPATLDLRAWVLGQQNRAVSFSIGGPRSAGAGMCLFLPRATQTSDTRPSVGDKLTTVSASFAGGEFSGDDDTEAHSNTTFALGVVA